MASAYRCDRCQKYYQTIGYTGPDYCICRALGHNKAGIKVDLCPDCNKKLDEWMDGKATLDEVDDE